MDNETNTAEDTQNENTQTNANDEHSTDNQQSQKPELKYTDDDVDEIVKKRLARAEADKQKAVDEAQKLAKMNADQKKDYAAEKTKKELEAAQSELATLKMGKTARAMFEEADSEVSEDDLTHVVTADAESTKVNVNWLIEHDKRVAEAVRKQYLKGSTPRNPASKGTTPSSFSVVDFANKNRIVKN